MSQIDAKKATVAVVVNGTIAAVARTSTTGGATRFYAMLPPRLFAAPTDVVEVFLLERDPLGRPLLLGARAGPSQNSERQPNTRCAGA